jgi:hypothetical protein
MAWLKEDPIVLEITGKSAEAIRQLQHITKKTDPVDVVISALRIYEWILAQQTRDATVVCQYHESKPKWLKEDETEVQLEKYVKSPEIAFKYFADRDIF